MSSRAFAIAAAVAVLLAAPRAEARFGKRSDSGSSSSDSSEHKASPASSSEHKAVRVDAPSYDGPTAPPPSHHAHVAPGVPVSYPVYERHYYYGWGFGYLPYFYTPPPPGSPVEQVHADARPSGPSATLGVSAQGHGQGATLGLNLAIEGERFGFNTEVQGIYAREPGHEEVDSIKLVDMHLTYAALSGDHGRVRLEGGFDWAIAPDAMFFGPDIGVSGALGLVGGFGLEGAVHYTPILHQRVDLSAGVAWALGPLGFRGGLRYQWLDDRALLWDGDGDGKYDRNTDTFFGPYFGVGLVF